ncbi:anti-sigma factor N-terminal domain protein [Thermoanaerobacter sp. YS13]|uniref:anti-sigma factor domain-containing protein n=1 Tax=Thermoanaerobacter sp. YS13 TaxID=1511746 RepID=UPI000574F3CC|nr:anti-sigma factor domain-containing protein [Thermoanaerobacter sp. YS13]KHO61477.1 anti-sigma factor N-terminal domain protein [Thermoanaerobacter sp. YS13]
MKAVVVQKEKNKTYVMTEKGEFKCLKNLQNVNVGETIELNENFVVFKSTAKILIAASILLALIFTIINFKSAEVYAYVYIDINPSIEISIDKNGKIINALPLNEDGKKILDKFPYKGLDITTFINQTVEESQKLGFLKEDDTVIITTVPIKNSPFINEQIEKAVKNIKKINTNIQIETLKSDETQREEAKKEKTSPGRLILWEKAKSEGINIPKDKLNSPEFFKELKQAYTKIKEKDEQTKATTIPQLSPGLSKSKFITDKILKTHEKDRSQEKITQTIKNIKDEEVKSQSKEVKKDENSDNKSNQQDNGTQKNTRSKSDNTNNVPTQKEKNEVKPASDDKELDNVDKSTNEDTYKNVKDIKNYPPKDDKNDEEYNEKMKEVEK